MKDNRSFRSRTFRFGTALNLIKCHKQIKEKRLLLTCLPISELPSSMSKDIVNPLAYGKTQERTDREGEREV